MVSSTAIQNKPQRMCGAMRTCARGFEVLRFWASDVEGERDCVIETILNALARRAPPVAVPPDQVRGHGDTLPETGRDEVGARYRKLIRMGLQRRDKA